MTAVPSSPSTGRRLLAVTALIAFVLALVVVAVALLDNFLALVLGVACLGLASMAAYVALVSRAASRWLAAILAATLAGAVVVDLFVSAELVRLVPIVALSTIAIGAARGALGPELTELARSGGDATPVRPAEHPALLINPRSGGGKAERFDLVGECRRRGIAPIALERGDDLEALAEKAALAGADVIGMAGGDGSQALVAGVSSRHQIAHVCVPAGTRNHLALDLGLDRDDVVGALDAYGDALKRTVDVATVNGMTFVNNVDLGVYAEVNPTSTATPKWRRRSISSPICWGRGPSPSISGSRRPRVSGSSRRTWSTCRTTPTRSTRLLVPDRARASTAVCSGWRRCGSTVLPTSRPCSRW